MDDYELSKCNTKRYHKIKELMKETFGYNDFKPKQYEIINNIINGIDVCAILPTGYGKSLTFQLPGIYLDKPTVIVSPLISLMEDQCYNLKKIGINACCYNSTIPNKYALKSEILEGYYKFIYITPETIIVSKELLEMLNESHGISLIAIDEAHCISTYGFDFRSAYRQLSYVREMFPDIPILTLTATATNQVVQDICDVMNFQNYIIVKSSFDRPNLELNILRKNKKMSEDLMPIINKHKNQPTIIYCLTKKETHKISDMLEKYDINCGIYHSSIDNDEKTRIHHQFLNGEINYIVATIAFGMGINKPNVRVVIHYGCPKNVESYYQEIGRAGRDGNDSYCYLLYGFQDFRLHQYFINNTTNLEYKINCGGLLEVMKNYVLSNQCRRKLLLNYFNENYQNKCDKCDVCYSESGIASAITDLEVKPISEEANNESLWLINLINEINENYGKTYYIDILRGSNSKKIKKNHKSTSYYGIGKNKSIEWWENLIKVLVKRKYLTTVMSKTNSLYPLLKTTKEGTKWANNLELKQYTKLQSNKSKSNSNSVSNIDEKIFVEYIY